MQRAHYINNFSVIPVEGLSRRELFNGIKIRHQGPFEEVAKEKSEGQEEIIRRLQRMIPDFIDETAVAGDHQVPNIFSTTNYNIPLPNGRINGSVKIYDDLGKEILEYSVIASFLQDDQKEKIADLFTGKSGVTIEAQYHLRRNDGRGLQLGRFNDRPVAWGTSSDYSSRAFERALNALCQGVDLTREAIYCGGGKGDRLSVPLSYHDGITEIGALIRNVSLEAIRAADQPVGEFMAWMQENAISVNTVGELVRLAVHSYRAAEGHEERAKDGLVVAALSGTVHGIGDRYLQLAQEAAAKLQPPTNNRMDYLIHR